MVAVTAGMGCIVTHCVLCIPWQPDCVEELVRLGADIKLRNQHHLTALDLAGHYDGKTNLKARIAIRKKVRTCAACQFAHRSLVCCTSTGHKSSPGRMCLVLQILALDPQQRTLVLYHDDCLGHATPDYHQVTQPLLSP